MKNISHLFSFLLFLAVSISANAQCANGNQTSFGNGSWIGYAYSYSGTPAPTTYIGFVTEPESFNTNMGTGAITGNTTSLCATPSDNFYVSYKMTRTFQPGSYTFTVGGDDGYRLKIANEAGYSINNWGDHGYATSTTTKVFNTTTAVDFVLEYYEKAGSAQVSFNFVCNSTDAPTSVSGATSLCLGESATLTAVGSAAPFEWGTGAIGTNIISGQNNATLTVSPTSTTTYWVRSLSNCRTSATAVTAIITVNTINGNPSIYGSNVWNIYGYNTTASPAIANYRGYYIQNSLNADTQDMANNGWSNTRSPAVSAGWNGCSLPDDNFTFVHKRKGFPCGKYELFMDNWDDNTQVLINGISILDFNGWSGGYTTPYSGGIIALDENSTIDIITKEFTGGANMKIRLVAVNAVYNGSSWSVSPDGATAVVNSGSINLTSNTTLCSCTLTGNSSVTVKDGITLIVKDFVSVASTASFTVENNASLVQINDNATNIGSINVKRTTAPVKRYDFTYWSSPVGSGFTLYNLSPNTLGDKYYSYDPLSGWVIHYNGNQAMEAGKGYLVRAPQNYDINIAAVYPATFIGKPNNGIINKSVVANASNLIGNPYPSAISADAIYNANSDKIAGTFYFWTHNSLPNSTNTGNSTYNYTADDYASYNIVGGVKTKPATYGGQAPTGNIGSGQSFFIAGKTSADITFSNSMRVKTSGDNSQFFRTSNTTQSQEETVTVEKNRFWLNISNEAGDFNETLVGYVLNATNGLDESFDGANLSSGTTTLYSIIDTNNLVIQGRALPFANTDVVPLGMKISTAGQYTINMDQFDGLFTSQNIYLFDNLTNTTHDLKANDYVFNSEAGTFNSRFEIRYVNGTELGIDTPIVSNNDVIVYKTGNQIAVKATNFTIDNIQVYDLTGKVIFSKAKVNSNEFATTGLNVGTQVVIVKVNLDNNQSVSKKVIMN